MNWTGTATPGQRAQTIPEPQIDDQLLQRLHEAGVTDIFGVPGDYALRLFDRITHSPIRHVGATREDTAAFAADGYARCRGLGALAVTYGVGALNVVNAGPGPTPSPPLWWS